MRIGLNTPVPEGVSSERTSDSAASPNAKSVVPAQSDAFSSDTVSLSELASRALQSPEIRQDKVDSLRQQIESGQYQVDARAIADAIVNQER
ncbi:MAG TPA: flagellar biosynthesis anti-sigma factor FlgM [Terriglobales bacterium]|nr:flagellar biosynthesis anti-sigma factor FlgM [Terriglobales bacterium]HXY14397.1 flagellar biosynthesis anti-sigma factor FlgM [Terriglobales bacterium]